MNFPYAKERSYTPPAAPLEQYLAMHDTLGISRGVLIQGSAHGLDNSALLDALRREPMRLRGVVVIDRHKPVKELQIMADAGVRGARFNHLFKDGKPAFKGGSGIEEFLALSKHMADMGWHVQLWLDCKDLPELWTKIKDYELPIVVDHMGRIDARQGLHHPGFDFLVRLLGEGKIWVKLSGIYRASDNWPGYPEVKPYHNALVAANPEQCVWGLDWPHPALKATMPNDGGLLNLLNDWVPDEAARKRILVENPARLYGFERTVASGNAKCA